MRSPLFQFVHTALLCYYIVILNTRMEMTMRLFISVNFDNETKKRLKSAVDSLSKNATHGNYSREENLHITLAFLGECDRGDLKRIRDCMDAVPAGGFEISIDRAGTFGRKDDQIFWVGAAPSDELFSVQRELVSALCSAGFEPDMKPFRPHITLARRFVPASGFSVIKFEEEFLPISFRVEKISLMQSSRIGGVLTYTELSKKEL